MMIDYQVLYFTFLLVFTSSTSCGFVSSFTSHELWRRNGIQTRSSLAAAAQEHIPRPGDRGTPQGGDMAYTKQNIDRQLFHYNQIRNVGGVTCCSDVYARSLQQPNIFWFTAKVARCTGRLCCL